MGFSPRVRVSGVACVSSLDIAFWKEWIACRAQHGYVCPSRRSWRAALCHKKDTWKKNLGLTQCEQKNKVGISNSLLSMAKVKNIQQKGPFFILINIAGFRICIHLIRIRIQHFRPNTDPDPGFLWAKLKKIDSWKKKKKFGSKTTICLSLGLHKGRPSYKRSLQLSKREHLALKNMKFLIYFLLLWVIFALLDLDPDSE